MCVCILHRDTHFHKERRVTWLVYGQRLIRRSYLRRTQSYRIPQQHYCTLPVHPFRLTEANNVLQMRRYKNLYKPAIPVCGGKRCYYLEVSLESELEEQGVTYFILFQHSAFAHLSFEQRPLKSITQTRSSSMLRPMPLIPPTEQNTIDSINNTGLPCIQSTVSLSYTHAHTHFQPNTLQFRTLYWTQDIYGWI